MKPFFAILACGLLLFSTSCSSRNSREEHSFDEYQQRKDAVKDIEVILPAVTPYDYDDEARRVYLSAYEEGYKVGLTGFAVRPLFRQRPNFKAHYAGYHDGQRVGREVTPYRWDIPPPLK